MRLVLYVVLVVIAISGCSNAANTSSDPNPAYIAQLQPIVLDWQVHSNKLLKDLAAVQGAHSADVPLLTKLANDIATETPLMCQHQLEFPQKHRLKILQFHRTGQSAYSF